MKMICPHCGVKGSVNDSLLGTKVKCPKCLGIFEVGASEVPPPADESMGLDQAQDSYIDNLDETTDQEVDDVFNDLLGKSGDSGEGSIHAEDEIDRILMGDVNDTGQDTAVASLSDYGDDLQTDDLFEEEDETLTIIEDFPDEVIEKTEDETVIEEQSKIALETALPQEENLEEELGLDDTFPIETNDTDLENLDDKQPEQDDATIEETLGFDDDLLDDSKEESEEELAEELENRIVDDEGLAPEEEQEKTIAEELHETEEKTEVSEELEEETLAEEVGPKDTAEEITDEITIDADESADDIIADADVDTEESLEAADEEDDEQNDQQTEKDKLDIIRKCAACNEYVDPDFKYEHGNYVYCSVCVPPGASPHQQVREVTEEVTEAETIEDEEFTDAVEVQEQTEVADDSEQVKAAEQTEEADNTERAEGEDVVEDSDFAYRSESIDEKVDPEIAAVAAAITSEAYEEDTATAEPGRFTVTTLIKDAYHYSKGAKGSILVGFIVMYLILIGIGLVDVFLLPKFLGQNETLAVILAEVGFQAVLSIISFILFAGIIMIAVRKVGQQPFSWKMVFSGFKKFGTLLLLFVLQSIMLTIGFILFILPGIYLSVGYMLAIPLIFMKGLSPWQALETSRIAIHKRWWTVFFALIAMSILTAISSIPLGIGLIWTIPMFVVLIAVLYYHFFGADD